MKRVIDGVEYQAINTDNDQCHQCIGNEIGSLSLCRQLRNDCHYKIWIKVDTEETQNKDFNMHQTNKTNKSHKHAEDMKLYAEDASTTDKPWELWECRCGTYGDEEDWCDLENNPTWAENRCYRRKAVKPKTININGCEVPEPLQNAPEDGELFWCADVYNLTVQVKAYDPCYIADKARLENGLLHPNMVAAQKHLDALLSFTRKK